jgi:hypothetical protein
MKTIICITACVITVFLYGCYEESFTQIIEPKTGWTIKNPDLSATFGIKEYFTHVYFLNENTGWVIGQSGII